jgi:hypothetical protein
MARTYGPDEMERIRKYAYEKGNQYSREEVEEIIQKYTLTKWVTSVSQNRSIGVRDKSSLTFSNGLQLKKDSTPYQLIEWESPGLTRFRASNLVPCVNYHERFVWPQDSSLIPIKQRQQ